VIEGGAFQKEVTEREIMAVPMVFMNGSVFGSGRMTIEEIVAKLDTGAASRDAAKLSAKEAFDVLIIGGGLPARQPPCTRLARAFAPAWRPSALAARSTTRWRSRTTSPCWRPTAPSSPRPWKPTPVPMTWTS
jgi:alkyl hydroperoxide reductase subunit F